MLTDMARLDPELVLTPTALIGLLISAARIDVLPARTWALQVALTELDGCLGPDAPRVLSSWPRRVGSGGVEFVGVERVVRQLVTQSYLRPEGSGREAGYRVSREWLDQSDTLLALMAPLERAALRRGGQRLSACSQTLSKNARAAGLKGSGTI